MPSLSIQPSITPRFAGISLRGNCCSEADIQLLHDAFLQLPTLAGRQLWVDCQHLARISYQGQRALLWADNHARTLGTTVYWCGFSADILTQLGESGLSLLLRLLPASAYSSTAELITPKTSFSPRP
ncbi:hypothetical protein [Hymenobacter pini]|uniref:hypothetical protein n=1 Tax=Hymenobacter pini TaxID=2880879 RepID=UPI001CF4C17E|nr:hypothetical protein [Hymenobacter pini]MCA8829985.1 hypothetical protein [Hymenobacter pini]